MSFFKLFHDIFDLDLGGFYDSFYYYSLFFSIYYVIFSASILFMTYYVFLVWFVYCVMNVLFPIDDSMFFRIPILFLLSKLLLSFVDLSIFYFIFKYLLWFAFTYSAAVFAFFLISDKALVYRSFLSLKYVETYEW